MGNNTELTPQPSGAALLNSDQPTQPLDASMTPNRLHPQPDLPAGAGDATGPGQAGQDQDSVVTAANTLAEPKPAPGGDAADPERGQAGEGELARAGYKDIFRQFALMGWTAFGGPSAHIALFQKTFVEKLHWMSESVFLELLALAQCLPGPSSTQLSFALGTVKRGIAGGLLSGGLFQYPGLIIMSLVGLGAADWLKNPAGWLSGATSGLGAVGVALVASSAKALTHATSKDAVTRVINTTSTVVAYYYTSAWIFPTLIVLGGLTTLIQQWRKPLPVRESKDNIERLGVGRIIGSILVAAWAIILIVSVVATNNTEYNNNKILHWWTVFYRIGAIIWGGGQVVLPLLVREVVQTDCGYGTQIAQGRQVCIERPDSWMTYEQFYTGLAVVQAMPGPLFNLAAYIGAVIAKRADIFPLWGMLVCWVGLFAPGILLIYGVLPWWGRFRSWPLYRKALPGLNAAAVGLVTAAVFQLVFKLREISPFPDATICIGIIGFALADFLKVPAPAAIGVGGVLGIIAWATSMR